MKKFSIKPLVLSKPKDKEPFYIYLLVTKKTISSVLVREEEKQQKSVYYVRKTLQEVEVKYQKIEKLAFALKPPHHHDD